MVSFHILLLDRAGNNLVNADFSPYSRMFFTVKHIYLTLYVVYTCRTAPIYSVPACACSLRCSRPPDAHPLAAVRLLFVAYLLAYVFAALAYVLYRLGDCYIFNNMSLGLFFTCARCACLPAPVRARACVCVGVWPCSLALAVRAARSARCGRRTSGPIASGRSSCLRPRDRACSRCSRLYCSFSRRASARWACRKLF